MTDAGATTKPYRLELYADNKLIAKQEVLVPVGLKPKTTALVVIEIFNKALLGAFK